jgi:hypothetical protein
VERRLTGPELDLRHEDFTLSNSKVDVDLAYALKRFADGGTLKHGVEAAQDDVSEPFLGEPVAVRGVQRSRIGRE